MTDEPEEPKDAIPAFRVSDKKVDESWKEEVRREREAAAKAAGDAAARTEAPPAAPGAGKREAAPQAPATSGAAPEKPAQMGPEQQQSKVFMTFLAGLAQQALMQLGDIQNPFSGQQEVDLQGARYTVELLNTLRAKTKGNL
ncbi:MAG: DUF1844 domain-containing protein, partial [Planctomycetota bacterium]|nr:DUF1844 domain-containing protein [Planctomycetota bacterium]